MGVEVVVGEDGGVKPRKRSYVNGIEVGIEKFTFGLDWVHVSSVSC